MFPLFITIHQANTKHITMSDEEKCITYVTSSSMQLHVGEKSGKIIKKDSNSHRNWITNNVLLYPGIKSIKISCPSHHSCLKICEEKPWKLCDQLMTTYAEEFLLIFTSEAQKKTSAEIIHCRLIYGESTSLFYYVIG